MIFKYTEKLKNVSGGQITTPIPNSMFLPYYAKLTSKRHINVHSARPFKQHNEKSAKEVYVKSSSTHPPYQALADKTVLAVNEAAFSLVHFVDNVQPYDSKSRLLCGKLKPLMVAHKRGPSVSSCNGINDQMRPKTSPCISTHLNTSGTSYSSLAANEKCVFGNGGLSCYVYMYRPQMGYGKEVDKGNEILEEDNNNEGLSSPHNTSVSSNSSPHLNGTS